MKNKRNRNRNASSKFNKSSDTSYSIISEEISSQDEKCDFPSKTESRGYSRKMKSRHPNSLDELTKKFLKYVIGTIVQ